MQLEASWLQPGFFACNRGEHPGDHNHQDFPKSTAIQMGGVLQYKWKAYCDTNGRSTDSISLSSQRRGTQTTAIQMGGVLQGSLDEDIFFRGQRSRTRKKTNSWERRFPGTFRTNVPLILPIFSVFSVGGGPKVPRNFVPGNFFFLF